MGTSRRSKSPFETKASARVLAGAVMDPQKLSYSKYLKIPELLSLQNPLSEPLAHDELLFIITHQTYELWFKQVLHEMEYLIQNLLKNNLIQTFRTLNRLNEIFQVLVQQINILETMSPVEFNQFRSGLNPASGFQSIQFREVELLAGADPAFYEKLQALGPEWKDKLSPRMRNLNLRTAFLQCLATNNLLLSREEKDLPQVLQKIYHDPKLNSFHALCEGMIQLDEQLLLWRFRHLQMVERMIGKKKGTGGSLGAPYLASTLERKFFPEIWDARTEMTTY